MKHIIKITGVIIALIALVSCEDFLEEVPKTQASPENYYQTEAQAEAAVVGAYNALQRNGVYPKSFQFFVTDLVRTAYFKAYGGLGTLAMSGSTGELEDIWKDHYQGINEANAIIGNLPKADMDENRKNTLIAEAKFLKALLHFNLVRTFGDVPYKDTETTSLNDLLVEHTPVAESYEKMIADLEFCIEHLDPKGVATAGRATTGAAQTLLAKIYLTRASMAKRDGTGDGLADFQKAAEYAQAVIDQGAYSLCEYYPDAFTVENKNNDEIVFDVQFKSDQFSSDGSNEGSYIGMDAGLMGNYRNGGSWAGTNATDFYPTLFEATDTVRRAWSSPHIRVKNLTDLKFYKWTHGERWKIGKYRRWPMRFPTTDRGDWAIHWPVFRYAEVLLIKAEALNEAGQDVAGIFSSLNQLRARARNVNVRGKYGSLTAPTDGTEYGGYGAVHDNILPRDLSTDNAILPDISAADYPNYDAIAQYIMDERARELGAESKRWFDLIRWGIYVERLQFLGTHIPEGRTKSEQRWETIASNVHERHILMPIPRNDLLANPNLKQNPGY